MNRKSLVLIFILVLNLSIINMPTIKAQEETGSISFQPSEIPNIEFSYNQEEYQFELIWKTYYLNVKPFAIYNQKYYTLKQIIPFLKNNYPTIDYRTAIQKFKNYHRWGFWLDKLPQDVADNLDYLGFELDYNIPLSAIEVEEIDAVNFTFKRIHIGGKFTLDFYDLYEQGFEVEINRTTILVGNVQGKTDIDLDPITYAAPTITVVGYNGGPSWTFWDVWNASNVNGWGVVHNNQNNNTQFQIDCKLVIGDGITATGFSDLRKQIFFNNASTVNNEIFWQIKSKSTVVFGANVQTLNKITRQGVEFIFYQDTVLNTRIYVEDDSTVYFYACSFEYIDKRIDIEGYIDRVWDGITDCLFDAAIGTDFSRLINQQYFAGPINCTFEDSMVITNANAFWTSRSIMVSNVLVRTSSSVLISMYTVNDDHVYFIDVDSNVWGISWVGGASSKALYRQYTFNIMVVDDIGREIENANVTLFNADGTQSFSVLTYANGSITEQTVSRGFYNQTGGDVLYDYGPFELTISVNDRALLNYSLSEIVLDDPVDWIISLTPIPLLRGSGGLLSVIILAPLIGVLLWGIKKR